MTAIIGIKRKNRIIIGADGISSYLDIDDNEIIENNRIKVKRIDGSPSCLIACAGRSDNINAIVNITNLLDKKENVSHSYMVKHVVKKIFYECAIRSLLLHNDEDAFDDLNASIIIATKKKLYYITSVGTVIDIKNVVCIGSGSNQLCSTYLNINNSNTDMKEIAIECLKSASNLCVGIGYPFTIGENDKNKEIEIIYENI